ncbi:hypothetical protein HMPREF1861_00823 [Corynebacterium kroppenstedtii]|nr:hypothetical protein HMPREF1861_00823 [Corynebacterium kroppenstedtii]
MVAPGWMATGTRRGIHIKGHSCGQRADKLALHLVGSYVVQAGKLLAHFPPDMHHSP